MRFRSGRPVAAAALGVTLLGLAACGGAGQKNLSDLAPKKELTTAISNLSDQSTLTVKAALDVSKEDLQAIAKATGGASASDQRTAALLAGADLTFELKAPGDKKLSDYKPGSTDQPPAEFAVDVDGSPIIELRVVDQVIYLRADVAKIMQLAQQPPQALAQLEQRIPSSLAFAHAALEGKWVSLSEQALKSLASQLGGSTTMSTAQAQDLMNAITSVIDNDVTVNRTVKSDANGDQLTLEASSRKLVTDLLGALAGNVPGGSALTKQFKPGDVPETTVKVDAVVDNSRLQKMSLELTQFASAADQAKLGGKKVPLSLTFASTGPDITKPASATQVDLSQLFTILGALGAGSASGSASG